MTTNTFARNLYTRLVHELPISTARAIIREYPNEEDYIDANYIEKAHPTMHGTMHEDNSIVLSMRWRAAKTICQKEAK